MNLTEKYLRKLIKEELEKEMNDNTVSIGYGGGGSYISRNGEPVSSEELAEAFGDIGKELLSAAEERGGGSVDQDAFIQYYLKDELSLSFEEIAKQYAESIDAEYKGYEESEEEY